MRPTPPTLPPIPSAVDNVSTTSALTAAGVARSTIAHRCRAGGPWRRLLPGVVLLDQADPTRGQLLRASCYRFGEHVVITDLDALRAHGVGVAHAEPIHLLVPTSRRTQSTARTVAERTTRMPEPTWVRGLPFAPPQRAAIDAARRQSSATHVRALLHMVVSEGVCSARQLWDEVGAGNQRGTASVRDALRTLGNDDTIASFGLAKRILRRCALPAPDWHVTVCDKRGRAIAPVDAWWDDHGVGWQFSPELTGQNSLTHLSLDAAGVVLVRSTVEQLRHGSTREIARLVNALRVGTRRPRPAVLAR